MRITKILAALALATAVVGAHSAQQFINIATGGTSGVYYPLGVALSQVFTEEIPDAKTSVQSTKGSVENLNLLQRGRAELAFALADATADAWESNAEAGFKGPLDKLRAVAAIYPNYIHLVASADAGIKTIADIKGKRISVGAPKSGNELNTRAILTAAGLSYDDFSKVEYLPYAESVELIKNRQLDMTLLSGGLGVAALRDLATSIEIVFVPIPAEVVTQIGNPAYQVGAIPANTYKGQTAELPTVQIRNLLVTHADVPEDIVYAMTKALFNNLDHLVNAHHAAKDIALDTATQGLPVPLHPGAARYYEEANVQVEPSP